MCQVTAYFINVGEWKNVLNTWSASYDFVRLYIGTQEADGRIVIIVRKKRHAEKGKKSVKR
jgi:hypothetical protein